MDAIISIYKSHKDNVKGQLDTLNQSGEPQIGEPINPVLALRVYSLRQCSSLMSLLVIP